MASPRSTGIGGLVAVVVLAVCGLGGAVARINYHDHIVACTITDKDRGATGKHGNSHYRVYTRQCGTLANEDEFLLTKMDSGDVQGRLERGHTYRLRVVGPRQPWLSMFPNIVSIEGEVPSR